MRILNGGKPKPKVPPKPREPRQPRQPTKKADSRYVVCPGNGVVHHGFALKISRSGKKRCPTVRCPVCKARAFLDPEKFSPGVGMTMTQVKAAGLLYFEE